MNSIEVLRSLLEDKGVSMEKGTSYVFNEGMRIKYDFVFNGKSVSCMEAEIESIDKEDLSEFADYILSNIEEKGQSVADAAEVESYYELMKTGVILPDAVNTDANRDFLNMIYHKEVMDLSLIYRLVVSDENGKLCTALVDEDMMKGSGVNEEELFQRAKKYVLEHMDKLSMYDVLGYGEGTAHERNVPDNFVDMYMLVFREYEHSAGILAMAALDEEVLKGVAETNPVILIPSSVDEILVIEDSRWEEGIEMHARNVEDVNVTVPVSKLLSDSVYLLQPSGLVKMVHQGKPLDYIIEQRHCLGDLLREMFGYVEENLGNNMAEA